LTLTYEMEVTLDINSDLHTLGHHVDREEVHYLPCHIHYDGLAPIASYFLIQEDEPSPSNIMNRRCQFFFKDNDRSDIEKDISHL
jgi:hypothetical protein